MSGFVRRDHSTQAACDVPNLNYRRCPGRHFSDATIWLFVVATIAVFNVSSKETINVDEAWEDEDGLAM